MHFATHAAAVAASESSQLSGGSAPPAIPVVSTIARIWLWYAVIPTSAVGSPAAPAASLIIAPGPASPARPASLAASSLAPHAATIRSTVGTARCMGRASTLRPEKSTDALSVATARGEDHAR